MMQLGHDAISGRKITSEAWAKAWDGARPLPGAGKDIAG